MSRVRLDRHFSVTDRSQIGYQLLGLNLLCAETDDCAPSKTRRGARSSFDHERSETNEKEFVRTTFVLFVYFVVQSLSHGNHRMIDTFKPFVCLGVLLLGAAFMTGCEQHCAHSQAIEASPSAPVHPLPLLPEGQHLGFIEGFNPDNPPKLRRVMDEAFQESLKNGMKVVRVQMDWPDVEPGNGIYDKGELTERLLPYQKGGLAVFLLLCTADTGSLGYPQDLLSENGDKLARGMKPDDPIIIKRYNKMLDWAIPLAKKHGVYCISVGNEPDSYHEADPSFMAHFIRFVAAVRDHAHAIDPSIAITYTSTCDPILGSGRDYANDIADCVDIVCFNLYGFGNSEGLDTKATEEALEDMLALSKGKPVQIQELGCSSFTNPDRTWQFHKSTPEIQRQFFVWAFKEIEARKQIRVAYVFQLVEHSPFIDKYYSEAFGGEGVSESWTREMCDWLKGLGLIRFDNAEAKPAWDEFLKALSRINKETG